MDEDDLLLNSLSRFAKKSPRLTLEEHGHCEVPAGCGGVVLRWFDARSSVPVILSFWAAGEAETFLDGEPVTSARPILRFGNHVLAIHLTGIATDGAAFAFAAARDSSVKYDATLRETGGGFRLVSCEDGAWKCTTRAPDGDGWKRAEGSEAGWEGMVRADIHAPGDLSRWILDTLEKAGASGLRSRDRYRELWVRRAFRIDP